MASVIRQNYHENCEAAINKQINMELYASYVYLSLVSWWRAVFHDPLYDELFLRYLLNCNEYYLCNV